MSQQQSRLRLKRLLSHLHSNQTATNTVSNDVVLTKILPSGIGVIILNNPPVNSLPSHVLYAIDKAVRKFQNDGNIKAVIVTGQKRFFCGGADINVLKKIAFGSSQTDDRLNEIAHPIFNNIEDGTKPFIAAVNGYALGGGCELALVCHYRLMSTSASIGLVESTLGLIPGFGGTQRLPRLMGISEGMYAIFAGKQYTAKHALRKGIVDEICDPKLLLKQAEQIALEFVNGKRKIRRALYLTDKIVPISTANRQLVLMKKRFSKLFHVSPSAEYAINSIMGIYKGPKEGLNVEIDQFNKIIKSNAAKAQLHLFFAQRATTKIGIPIKGKLSKPINKIAILGGGTMGCGIATLLICKGFKVILKEISTSFCDNAFKNIKQFVTRSKEKGVLRKKSINDVLSLITVQTDYNGFNSVDLVIEAVSENLALKQELFKQLVNVTNDQCILATNTSAIDINKICLSLSSSIKSRVIGLHFATPAHIMPILEIVRTNNTDPVVVADMVKLSKKIGKIAVVVRNCVGFAANRMFYPYFQAGLFLIEHGVNPYRIDKVLENFGITMGVFKVMDLSGIDIVCNVENEIKNSYNYCYNASMLNELVKLNRLGQKTKKGFYKYDNERNTFNDENELNLILNEVRNKKQINKIFSYNQLSDQDIIEICLFPVVNESFKILSQGVANKSSDLDIVSTSGFGFPKKRGGVHFWGINEIGLTNIVNKLFLWRERYGKESNLNLYAFFTPCDALLKAAGGY